MFIERQSAMMATLVSGCVWKRLRAFLVLDSVLFAMGARNGMSFSSSRFSFKYSRYIINILADLNT